MNTIQKIWYAIYPTNDEHKWMPLMWLPFMFWFFLDPYWKHASLLHWTWNTLAGLFFIVLYMQAFSRPRIKYICIALMLVMAAVFLALNTGCIGFLVYSAAAIGFTPNLRWVVPLLVVDVVILLWSAYRLHLDLGMWGSFLMLIILVGFGNHHWAAKQCAQQELRLANDEIEHLAKVAERERIARDLHDVLGHTLSLITLKSELAGKLIDRDPVQARAEIRDVEQTARQALADVRQAIGGYRSKGLDAEIRQARSTLETAGVQVDVQSSRLELPATQESVLALSLREAVTNVVRHAQASHCSLRLERLNGNLRLEVHDDGCGGAIVEGN